MRPDPPRRGSLSRLRPQAAGLFLFAALIAAPAPPPLRADGASVTVALTGSIAPACTLGAPNLHVDFGEIKQAGTAFAPFSVSCNTGFRVSLSSQNGGLLHTGGSQASPPFIALVPYKVALTLGGNAVPLDVCPADHMTSAFPACSGPAGPGIAVANQKATLGFVWDLHGGIPLAGSYRDILTVTVTPGL